MNDAKPTADPHDDDTASSEATRTTLGATASGTPRRTSS